MHSPWIATLRNIAAATAMAVSILSAATVSADGPRPSVVLTLPFQSAATDSVTFESTFRQGLESEYGAAVDLRVEYLDLPDAANSIQEKRVTDLLAVKYDRQAVAAIVAYGPEALDYILERRQRLFPGAPVVFVNVSATDIARLGPLPPDVTGVQSVVDAAEAVRQTLALRPGTRSVALVGGASSFDRTSTAAIEEALANHQPPVEIVSLAGMSLAEQLHRVSALPGQSIVIVPSYRSDTSGRPLAARDVVGRIASSASVPTFGYSDTWLGAGIVGGQLIQSELLARRAAVLSARVLKGEPVRAIAQDTRPVSAPIFDWRQLERWGIDEGRLPSGSEVLFRKRTLWSEYKLPVLAGCVVFLGQVALIGALLLERGGRRRAQAGLAETEQRYRTVANFNADWEYWIGSDGSFLYVSPSCVKMTGYEAAEFIDRPEVVDRLFADASDRNNWAAIHHEGGRNGAFGTDVRIRTRTGELKWINVVATPVVGADGLASGVRGSARDVTANRQAAADVHRSLAEVQRLRDQLEVDNTYLREESQLRAGIDGIVGTSDVMRYVVSKIQRVAPTASTVLLLGETGVGKSQLALAIHRLGTRRDRPFVTLNCAALPPTLVESELFGHEKGAFTGAHSRRAGRFEAANGGTLFLDEIGELPPEIQSKLLRAVQDGTFERVGSNVPIRTDARLVVATNRALEDDVRAGTFRQDLWYRLNVFPITVPPLRQRPDDIPLLTVHFVEKHCRKLGRPTLVISKGTMKALQARDWPGNVRELESFVERTVISSRGDRFDIDEHEPTTTTTSPGGSDSQPEECPTLEELERQHILSTLDLLQWRIEGSGGAAEVLGINASTLRSRMRKLQIRRNVKRVSPQPRQPSDN